LVLDIGDVKLLGFSLLRVWSCSRTEFMSCEDNHLLLS
jgi:hypothetical protein